MNNGCKIDFSFQMQYELKRAERYRIFLSLVVINLGPIVDTTAEISRDEQRRTKLIHELQQVIKTASREIDYVSNSGRLKVGLLMPETSRQGAEAATRRVIDQLNRFCSDYFIDNDDYLVPVEISSFPDASGARSIASYLEEFVLDN